MEVLGQGLGRADDPLHDGDVFSVRLVGQGVGRDRHVSIAFEGLAVELADAGALAGVAHDDEVPAPRVRSARRLQRDLDTLFHQRERHGAIEVEAATNGARGGEELVGGEVEGVCHRATLAGCW